MDLTTPTPLVIGGENVTVCASDYSPGAGFNADLYDMILGDAFLRNTYSLFNHGDFVDPSQNKSQNAYIQLLPLVDVTNAAEDFARSRENALSQFPPEATLAQLRERAGLSGSTSTSSSVAGLLADDEVSSSSGYSALVDRVNTFGPAIIALLGANVLVGIMLCLLGIVIWIRKGATQGSTRTRSAPVYAPVRMKEEVSRAEDSDEPFTAPYTE